MIDASESNRFLARGGGWVVVQSILMTTVIVLGVMFHGNWTRLSVIAAGGMLFIAGGYLGIAGVGRLGRNRTPYPKPREGSELIQSGIYARVRHPLYTSVMLASVGWAMIWQSVPAFATALGLIPFFQAKARREEHWLHATFPGYADYARRVPRFIPRFGKTTDLVCYF